MKLSILREQLFHLQVAHGDLEVEIYGNDITNRRILSIDVAENTSLEEGKAVTIETERI